MDAKEEIRSRLSVEEVVGDYIELRPAGRNMKALSPFSSEKTPSFIVSPDKQIWHDFSSNKGGDIFTFVMEMEGVDFREALEILARKAGVDLAQFGSFSGSNSKLKQRLIEANQLAARYYQASLMKNSTALDYISKTRGFTKQTVLDFGLGYSPTTGVALTRFLDKKGFSDDEIKRAGLGSNRYGVMRDLFRGRLMVPLSDGQGQTVGFTGRSLSADDKGPKYLNTPATLIYDKGRQVFGLHQAKEAIREADEVVIVEGNLDVVASHQVGVKNVVATAGTALTKMHLNQLKRLSINVKLSFDHDRAGLAATERAVVLAQDLGLTLYVVNLPDDVKDPDELVQHDPNLWRQAIKQAPYVVDWVIDNYKQLFDIKTATGKRNFSDKVVEVLRKLIDPVEQAHYVEQVASLLDVSAVAIERKIAGKRETKSYKKAREGIEVFPDNTADEDDLLALLMCDNKLIELVRSMPVDTSFSRDERKQFFGYLLEHNNHKIDESWLKDLPIEKNYAKILLLKAEQKFDDLSFNERAEIVHRLKKRILARARKIQQQNLTAKIKQAEDGGDQATAQDLLKKYQSLIKEETSGSKEKDSSKN